MDGKHGSFCGSERRTRQAAPETRQSVVCIPFEVNFELFEMWRNQLSAFLTGLLNRKKEGSSKLSQDLIGESERARQLAMGKPRFWEFLLIEELLRSNLIRVRRDMEDVKKGLKRKPSQQLDDRCFNRFLGSKCGEIRALIHSLTTAWSEELPASWGEPGQPGDPNEIKRAVDLLVFHCERLVEWELDLRSVVSPEMFRSVHRKMHGWAEQMLRQIEGLPDRIAEPFKKPDPSGTYEIKLALEAPTNIGEVDAELDVISTKVERMEEDLGMF